MEMLYPSKDAADQHFKAAEYVIRALDNPDPTIILGILLATIIVIYIIYVFFFKQLISGIWINTKDKQKHHICHNLFTDKVIIDDEIQGELDGQVLNIADMAGLISQDRLVWSNGDIWLKASYE